MTLGGGPGLNNFEARFACNFFMWETLMGRTLGYILTWTTYGTWLQGDSRGWVKDGQLLTGNDGIRSKNLSNLKSGIVKFRDREKNIVRHAIENEAEYLNQKNFAISVCSNHVHVVVDNIFCPIEEIVKGYKNACLKALHESGFRGKVWTRGYDVRYCFDEKSLQTRIRYVLKQTD